MCLLSPFPAYVYIGSIHTLQFGIVSLVLSSHAIRNFIKESTQSQTQSMVEKSSMELINTKLTKQNKTKSASTNQQHPFHNSNWRWIHLWFESNFFELPLLPVPVFISSTHFECLSTLTTVSIGARVYFFAFPLNRDGGEEITEPLAKIKWNGKKSPCASLQMLPSTQCVWER